MALNEPQTQTRLSDLVAEEIRALLARRRVSGRELARQMGESPSWVNFRLTGHTPIGLNDLQRFATALGVTIADLLPREARRPTEEYGERTVRTRAHSSHVVTGVGSSAIADRPTPSRHRPRGRVEAAATAPGFSRPAILPRRTNV